MSTALVRTVTPADNDAIEQLALDNQMFESDELGDFGEMLAGFFDGTLEEHRCVSSSSSMVSSPARRTRTGAVRRPHVGSSRFLATVD
ncbi:MAG: hypothetical protein QNJ12_18690 [Ilumatobacter sp.]|uniref:hypothetical protein n=1 Tax=Ilumatobacter sp. TaxID=1967498 RepID=UPI002608AC7B|nr:hypothetical protein [Ilumatobacter sp.]MDJ0770828.1 hypothetical protein [Ilumatobacter sp.]